MEFMNHSLLAVREGRQRLQALGVPTRRPDDYFCEHIKSDVHMARVSGELVCLLEVLVFGIELCN